MNNIKIYSILTVFAVLLSFSSCKKDLTPVEPDNTSLANINVSADFDWKTTKDIQLTLTGASDGLAEVTKLDGTPYLKIFLKGGEPNTFKLTVPSYEGKVKLNYKGQVVELELSGKVLSYQF